MGATLSALSVVSMLRSSPALAQEPPPDAGTESDADLTPLASSQPCEAQRFIVLTIEGDLERALADEVRTDLAAELAHRGIAVCGTGTTREPAALVAVNASASAVTIELDDRVTHKRVGRDLPLAGLPANGRALAIAIAIDELLRASWAELTLRREIDDREPEEEQERGARYVTRPINARGSREPAPRRVALGGQLGYAHTNESFDAFSLSARATLHRWERGWFAFELGGLVALPAESGLGNVLASGVRTAATAGVCARDKSSVYACGGIRGELDYLSLRGSSEQMARASSRHAAVVQLSAVGMLALALPQGRALFGQLSLGSVLQGVEATDDQSRTILGVTGLMLAVDLGLEFEL